MYIKIFIFPLYMYIYSAIMKETQTWLSCHYKFISPENIIILSVSSNDFYMLDFRLWSNKCEITVHMCTRKKKINSQARAEGVKTIGVRNIKKQEQEYKNNPYPLSSDADWILLIYIYIYIVIRFIREFCTLWTSFC